MSTVLQLTRQQVIDLKPCSVGKIPDFRGRVSLTAAQALEAGVAISDLLWVAAKIGRKDLCVKFALACVQRVSHLNTDNRVEQALNATQAWLDNPNRATANAAASAAYAAYAAAYAAANAASAANAAANAASAANAAANAAASAASAANATANATANAAYAAAYAVDAAANAAYAAAYAVDATASAAYAAAYAVDATANATKERKEQRLIFLKIFSEPT